MQKLTRSLLALGAVIGLAACGDDVTVTPPTPPPTPTVTGVTVAPGAVTIKVNETSAFSASVQTNGTVANTSVTWSTVNPTVATVDANGVVTGKAVGSTSVKATSAANTSVFGSGTVTVVAPGVQSISVTPNAASAVAGTSLTATATVNRDAGVSAAVKWSSSNTSIATVSTSAATSDPITINAVSVGTVVITATSDADPTKSASLALTVTAQSAAITALTLTPNTVTLGSGDSRQVTAVVAAAPGATVAFSNNAASAASGCPGVASASTDPQTGATTITTVGSGSCVVTVTATGSGTNLQTVSIQATIAVTVIVPQISINSITAGGVPVQISNVAGQIDVNLNFQPNGLAIDSVVVSIQQPKVGGGTEFKRAAKQNFGAAVPAAGILTLSINTASFEKNAAAGTADVDYWNGQTTIMAQVFPKGTTAGSAVNCSTSPGDPTCAAPYQLVLNNLDGWAADIAKPARSAVSTVANAGATYWGGPDAADVTTAEIYAVMYNNNPSFASGSALNRCSNQLGDGTGCISTVTWTVGSPSVGGAGTCGLVTQTALPFTQTYGTSGQTGCGYENGSVIRDNIVITAAIDGTNNPFTLVGTPSLLPPPANPNTTLIANSTVFGATPDSLRLDYVGPNGVAPPQVGGWENPSYYWVNATWPFMPSGVKVSDLGVGPLESSWAAFASAQGGSSTTFPTPITTGADLPETNQNCVGAGCDGYNAIASATDLLANASNSVVTHAFGDDQTAPAIRYSSNPGQAGAPSDFPSIYTGGGSGTVLDSTTYNAIQAIPAAGVGDSIRAEALDNRSGLSRAVVLQSIFEQGGATGTVSATACSNPAGAFGASYIDGYRPGPQIHITCTDGVVVPIAPAPGYYTTSYSAVDRAGNVSAELSTGGPDFWAASTSSAPNHNVSIRRNLAYDPGQPLVTGLSPFAHYVGNAPATWSLGSQDDVEVIDARLRALYPNVTQGDAAATAANGLVWSYALSTNFMGSNNGMPAGLGPFVSGPASGTNHYGFFSPIALRFDNSIVDPNVTTLSLDKFTLNVQETCLGAASPTASCTVNGDPISALDVPATKPTNLYAQVRDVFGSWSYNATAGAATGVSAEYMHVILPNSVDAPGLYTVGYSALPPGCPTGGGAPGGLCVTSGVNFRADGGTGSTRNFRAVQPLSVTLPLFTRVELYGLNAASEWVFIQRCTVPSPIVPNVGPQACVDGGGTVNGTDNGLERYWVFSFTSIPATPPVFSQYRALGVNGSGFGLFSTVQP
ncbi:MAG: hypothetical protein MNPFHGCM_01309 [Gemmatimonadaceae bacterium]|nr:hypothetical protein [Gemmatimonadaceae bacterium]